MGSRRFTVGMLSALLCASAAAAGLQAPNVAWLIGDWVLCEDPDNSPKDTLQFNANGTGVVIAAKGNVEFLHRHTGRSVSLLANAKGNAIPIELTATQDFDALLLYSEKTGNTSAYVRKDSARAATCSAK